MEGILKVTPQRLVQASGAFAAAGNQIRSLTGEMMLQVQSMKGIWQEEAEVCGSKMQSLQTDMDRLYRMIQEHAKDLQEMAGHYQNAEAGNTQQGGILQSDIIV